MSRQPPTLQTPPTAPPAVPRAPEASTAPAPAADAASRPSLAGRRVLVDGYNLEMPYGTGIKRYGEDIVHHLRAAEARIGILFSCPVAPKPAVQEALLCAGQHRLNRPWQRWSDVARFGWSAYFGARAKRIEPTRYAVSDADEPWPWHQADHCLTAPNCFTNAIRTCALRSRPLRLSLPEPFDLVHLTSPLPIRFPGHARLVTTIHDLIPLRLPWAADDDKQVFYESVRYCVEQSLAIICISEHTRRDLIELFDVPEHKLHVTYEPVPTGLPHLEPHVVDQTLAAHGLTRDGYLLFVGNTMDAKKNVHRLLQAMSVADTNLPLVLAGPPPSVPWERDHPICAELYERRQLLRLGYVPNKDLAALYHGCRAFVFPSLYEGFGLPALEAVQFRRPVVTSNRTALPEVCGGAALYADPAEPRDIANKIDEVVTDEAVRDRLIAAGPAQLAKFSVENYRERLLTAYAHAMA
ncbi:MAG: glycosyltransferase family 1 protein [Phycisphaeraceae bacterium]